LEGEEEEKLSICAPPERAAVADPWNGQDGGGGGVGPRNTSRPPLSIARGGRRARVGQAVTKEDWGRCRAGGSDSWWGAAEVGDGCGCGGWGAPGTGWQASGLLLRGSRAGGGEVGERRKETSERIECAPLFRTREQNE